MIVYPLLINHYIFIGLIFKKLAWVGYALNSELLNNEVVLPEKTDTEPKNE